MLTFGRLLPLFALPFFLALPSTVQADEVPKDDTVSFDLVAETWASTTKATVILTADAAVSDNNAATTRSTMERAVHAVAKADWHLTNFTRRQDKTGLERWSVSFEARVADKALNGLDKAVKKASRPGLQIRVTSINFTPSLAEMETARAILRADLMKQAAEQLKSVNASLPGRNFRIASVSFSPERRRIARTNKAMMLYAERDSARAVPMDVSEKITLRAQVTCAASPYIRKHR